ncbi:MAG: FAD-linked oxidase C-terminal domain-containing protein, partial [Pseudomonadota bacterium]
AHSQADRTALWAIRETPAEYRRAFGHMTGFDIGLPVSAMATTVAEIEGAIRTRWPGAVAMSYGHVGDGNLHMVAHVPEAGADQPAADVSALVYDHMRAIGGTISAEHGIGTVKRAYMGHSRSPEELATMRAVKAALDPKGILNPGRSFAPNAVG